MIFAFPLVGQGRFELLEKGRRGQPQLAAARALRHRLGRRPFRLLHRLALPALEIGHFLEQRNRLAVTPIEVFEQRRCGALVLARQGQEDPPALFRLAGLEAHGRASQALPDLLVRPGGEREPVRAGGAAFGLVEQIDGLRIEQVEVIHGVGAALVQVLALPRPAPRARGEIERMLPFELEEPLRRVGEVALPALDLLFHPLPRALAAPQPQDDEQPRHQGSRTQQGSPQRPRAGIAAPARDAPELREPPVDVRREGAEGAAEIAAAGQVAETRSVDRAGDGGAFEAQVGPAASRMDRDAAVEQRDHHQHVGLRIEPALGKPVPIESVGVGHGVRLRCQGSAGRAHLHHRGVVTRPDARLERAQALAKAVEVRAVEAFSHRRVLSRRQLGKRVPALGPGGRGEMQEAGHEEQGREKLACHRWLPRRSVESFSQSGSPRPRESSPPGFPPAAGSGML